MKKITFDTLLSMRFLGQLKSSSKKQQFAFLRGEADLENNAYNHTLYLGNKNTIKPLRALKKSRNVIFQDEDTLLVTMTRTKQEEKRAESHAETPLYRLDIKTNTLKKIQTIPFSASLERMVDEETVLLSATLKVDEHALYETSNSERDEAIKAQEKEKAFESIQSLPYWFNGSSFTANRYGQRFLYNINDGTINRLTDKTFSVESHVFSPDGQMLYYTGKVQEAVKTPYTNVYAYNIKTKQHKTLYDASEMNIVKLMPFDEKLIVLAKAMDTYGLNENPDFYELKNKTLTLFKPFGGSFGNTIGTDCRVIPSTQAVMHEGAWVFVATVHTNTAIMRLTASGTLETVFTMDGSIDGIASTRDGLVMIGMKGTRLQEVYDCDLTKKTLTMRTRQNVNALKEYYVAEPISHSVDKETHTVDGFVLLPNNYNPSKKHPAILNIHGGPKTVYGSVFYHEMQVWVNLGYVVMFANPRGSDGKGNQFADLRGKYGTIDYDDLMDFTDSVLAKYKGIDEGELFVTGGSYGGFMTNWMVGHTNRFKAAVTQRSISNWLSFFGTSDIGYMFAKDQTGGDPMHQYDKLVKQSPITYADQIETPLLFIHADEDYRCPIEQAQQLYALLKVRGIHTEFLWVKGENHELSRSGKPLSRQKRLQAITNWFEQYRTK